MRLFRSVALLGMLAVLISGCAGPHDRNLIRNELNAYPMSEREWAPVKGTYLGPVRTTTIRGGFEGQATYEVRLDLSGPADAPDVVMYTDKGFSTAWSMYGERKGTYSNVPSKRYGSQGFVYATTHAPNQVMIQMRRFGLFSFHTTGPFMILTYRGNGHLDVEWVDHAGWRGEGELWRLPALLQQQ